MLYNFGADCIYFLTRSGGKILCIYKTSKSYIYSRKKIYSAILMPYPLYFHTTKRC